MANFNAATKELYTPHEKLDECIYCGDGNVPLFKEYIPKPKYLSRFPDKPIVARTCKKCQNRINYVERSLPGMAITLSQRKECAGVTGLSVARVVTIKYGPHAGRLNVAGAMVDEDRVYVNGEWFPLSDLPKIQTILAALKVFPTTKEASEGLDLIQHWIDGSTYNVLRSMM